MTVGWIQATWPAPAGVRAGVVTRAAPGVSLPPFGPCNLGLRSGDDPAHVAANRAGLVDWLGLPGAPHWLRQVHGRAVVDLDHDGADEPESDAAVTRQSGRVVAILSADCLPVLLATADGRAVAAAHAGWRGLAGGVLEATIEALAAPPTSLLAWLGPAIGAPSYEVGVAVHAAFVDADPAAAAAFQPTRPGHWLCDLAALARRRLQRAGIGAIHGGGFDTFTDPDLHSFRRDGERSGRLASLIWLDASRAPAA